MKLTAYTDYALRTLMYLGANRDRLVTIQDIADLHNIAKNHLSKVVHQLGGLGVIQTVRGRNGGLRLGKEPIDIHLGDLVRNTEPDFNMAECFNRPQRGAQQRHQRLLGGAGWCHPARPAHACRCNGCQ
jgi:Rrf2 family nitric oxide-sensitive transcriptional repressor